MSYAEVNTTNAAEVLAAIFDFADITLGWTVDEPNGDMTPTGKDTYRLTHSSSGSSPQRNWFTTVNPAATTRKAMCEWPLSWNSGAGTLNYVAPTRTFLFGDSVEEPWMSAVVEFGFNNYRHMYFGHANRLGAYTNGWLIYSNWYPNYTNIACGPGNQDIAYMFRAYRTTSRNETASLKANCGGIAVVHADNTAGDFRRFFMGINSINSPFDSVVGDEVFGGTTDGIIGALEKRGRAPFAGANILWPFNLFAVQGATTEDAELFPLGEASGIRGVNMDGLEPLQEIIIGTTTWKVFPEFVKGDDASVAKGSLGECTKISSGILGLAYPKDRT